MNQETPPTTPTAQWEPKTARETNRPQKEAKGGFKVKVLVGVIGAPIVAWAIIWGPYWLLATAIFAATCLALYETGYLLFETGETRHKVLVFPAGLALFAATAWGGLEMAAVGVAVIAAVLMALVLLERDLKKIPQSLSKLVFGSIYAGMLPAMLLILKRLEQPSGVKWLFLLFLLVWLCDAGAYFAGRSLGKTPMAPRISGKKTVEGLVGGVVASLLAGLICGWAIDALTWVDGLILGLMGALLGPVGDLVESALKRAAGVKDSGTLLPGHGGILDRLDAILFVAPFFLLFVAVRFPDALSALTLPFGNPAG